MSTVLPAALALAALAFAPSAVAAEPSGCADPTHAGINPAAFEYAVAWVDATRADFGDATEQAQQLAVDKLYARLQPGLPDVAEITVRLHITPLPLDPVNKGGNKVLACGVAFVEIGFVREIEHDRDALRTSVTSLARSVLQATGGEPVAVVATLTVEGCPAGSLGTGMTGRVREALAGAGVPTSSDPTRTWRLQLEVNPADAQGLTVAATLWRPSATTSVALAGAGFTVNPWILVRDVDRARAEVQAACTNNNAWGLDPTGHRAGRGGLHVETTADRDLEGIPSGSEVTFTISTNAPAMVQVYSLAPDGRSWLSAPFGEAGGHRVVVGAPWAGVRTVVDGSDPPRPEQLLVVAVPQDRGFGGTRPWAGFCAVPGALTPAQFPPDAAFHLVRFLVTPGETPPPLAAPMRIPECGTGRTVDYAP